MEDLSIILTPGFNGNVWYEKRPENNQLVIFGRSMNQELGIKEAEVSYRLVAPRIDTDKWGNEPDEPVKNPIRVSDFIKKLFN